MLFSEVAGQQAVKDGLLTMWHNNHMPHALLLNGPAGTGGLPLAVALAQYIFCTEAKDRDACGVCPDCSRIARLSHPDLHLSFPVIRPEKSGAKALSRNFIAEFREFFAQTPYGSTFDWLQSIQAEKKQGNISADECREIIDTLNLRSYEGRHKIQIIWRPEYLGKEGNILLKLIEEPPADTMLILVSENTEDILPTILSRTQVIRLAPIPAGEIARALQDRNLADAQQALQIGHLADGSFAEALRLLHQHANDLFPEVRNWFNGLFTNNGEILTGFVDRLSGEGREYQKSFLQYVIQLLEQAMRSAYLPQHPPALPAAESEFVKKLSARGLPLPLLENMTRSLSETIYFIERNAHAKTQLHALSIRLAYAIQNKPVPVTAS